MITKPNILRAVRYPANVVVTDSIRTSKMPFICKLLVICILLSTSNLKMGCVISQEPGKQIY